MSCKSNSTYECKQKISIKIFITYLYIMARTRVVCSICWSWCVWCWKKCRCWFSSTRITLSNSIIEKNKERLNDKAKIAALQRAVMGWFDDKEIYEIVSDAEELPYTIDYVEKPKSVYCEFPVWSWWKWSWVECIKCWLCRFETRGKECEWSRK